MPSTDYWGEQVKRLSTMSTSELRKLISGFKPYENHGTFGNYYAHLKREYAERIGK